MECFIFCKFEICLINDQDINSLLSQQGNTPEHQMPPLVAQLNQNVANSITSESQNEGIFQTQTNNVNHDEQLKTQWIMQQILTQESNKTDFESRMNELQSQGIFQPQMNASNNNEQLKTQWTMQPILNQAAKNTHIESQQGISFNPQTNNGMGFSFSPSSNMVGGPSGAKFDQSTYGNEILGVLNRNIPASQNENNLQSQMNVTNISQLGAQCISGNHSALNQLADNTNSLSHFGFQIQPQANDTMAFAFPSSI